MAIEEPEPEVPACSLPPAYTRLAGTIARLTQLFESDELTSSLQRAALGNPVRHGDRSISAADAWVIEILAGRAGPTPLLRLERRHVLVLPRLERAGLVHTDERVVQLTPRGRACGVARAHERAASKSKMRSWLNSLEQLQP